MKVMYGVLVIVILGICPSLVAQTWELVWSDEFDKGTVPDPSRWDYDLGTGCPQLCGWGNHEKQAYTRRPENARLEDGLLIIEARQESLDGGSFTSARLVTRGKAAWQYGRIEVRAKLPGGRGAWPAIWMLPDHSTYGGWPRSGEIDIMEHVGYSPLKVLGTVHCEAYNHIHGTQRGDSLLVVDAEDAFHVYAIEWYTDKIDFWVDKTHFFTFPRYSQDPAAWPFNQPFYLILNLAVGGNLGGRYGVTPHDWPRRLEVDYVRVYQQDDSR